MQSRVVNNPELSPPLLTPGPGGGPLRLNLTTNQQAALIGFLKTPTDTNLATNPARSDPFNYGDRIRNAKLGCSSCNGGGLCDARGPVAPERSSAW